MSRRHVRSGAAHLSVDENGDVDGAPVLLLHAGVTDSRSWDPLIERIDERTRHVRYDARGYGDSSYEAEDGWSPVDDAVAVLDACEMDAAILVGCSIGAATAIDLALARPERVSALVLIAPAINGAPDPQLEPFAGELDRAIDQADSRDDLEEVNRLEAHFWLDGPGHSGRVAGSARALFFEMNGRALAAADPGTPAVSADAFSRLGEISVPTLVLVGGLDLAHVRENAGYAAASIPHARLVELDDVAHLPQLEGHLPTLSTIVEFIDSVAAGR